MSATVVINSLAWLGGIFFVLAIVVMALRREWIEFRKANKTMRGED